MSALADIDIHFNNQGDFISPDVYLQSRGLALYQQGYINNAMGVLKQSAEFGNNLSKYIIAMLYFEQKNWITGLAWLKLVEEPIEDRDMLLKKFKSQLSKQELELSQAHFIELQKLYNNGVSFNRRNKWERSIVATGTHIKGIKAYASRNIVIGINSVGGNIPISSIRLRRQVLNFVQEIEPEGTIIMGEIKELDETE
jgi:hypothetical protein